MNVMKLSPVAAMCGCLVCGTAQAAVDLGELAGTSVSMEGLLQSDGYWFDNDRADLNGSSGSDGEDTEFGIRRAEVVLKGKGPLELFRVRAPKRRARAQRRPRVTVDAPALGHYIAPQPSNA